MNHYEQENAHSHKAIGEEGSGTYAETIAPVEDTHA